MTVAAAWYPDPVLPSRLRWWDGRAWTDFVADAPPIVREQSTASSHSAGFVVRAAAVREAQRIRLTSGTSREADAMPPSHAKNAREGTATSGHQAAAPPLTRRAAREAQRGKTEPAARTEAAARAEAVALAVAQADAIAAAEKQFQRSTTASPRFGPSPAGAPVSAAPPDETWVRAPGERPDGASFAERRNGTAFAGTRDEAPTSPAPPGGSRGGVPTAGSPGGVPFAAPRDWAPPSTERERNWVSPSMGAERGKGSQPVASARNIHLGDHSERFDWASGPKQGDATNGWTWLIALSPLWFTAAFAVPNWVDEAFGVGTMTEVARGAIPLVAWAILIAAIVFDWGRLRRGFFPQPASWALGVLLLPMYMILRAVRVHAVVRRGLGVMWLYLALQVGVLTVAMLPGMSFGPSVPVLDGTDMEQHVTETYLTDYGIEVSTSCPVEISLDVGREFRCDVVLPDGSVEIIIATVTDADGAVSWTPQSELPLDTTA